MRMPSSNVVRLALLLLALMAMAPACTDPDLTGRLFACETDGDCGDQWVCVRPSPTAKGGGVCRPVGATDILFDGVGADAAVDGAAPDGVGADGGADASGGSDAADTAGPRDALDTAGGADGGSCDVAQCPEAPQDTLACREPACDPKGCTLSIKVGWCLIDGACFEDGAVGLACTVCKSGTDPQGWSTAADGAACDDSEPCTTGDSCTGGVCQPGAPTGCDDDNVCTTESCQPGVGCLSSPVDGACDDGEPCTEQDTCSEGKCVGGPANACLDGDKCTDDVCIDGQGCAHQQTACDDGDGCTIDACEKDQGCTHTTKPCDDTLPCTVDYCEDGGCQHVTMECDDGVDCTDDVCSTAKGGCVYEPIDADCEDGDPCVEWTCDPVEDCTWAPLDGEPCDDEDACTPLDVCLGGVCDQRAFAPRSPLSTPEDKEPGPPWAARASDGIWVAVWESGGGVPPVEGPGLVGGNSSIIVARSSNDAVTMPPKGPLEAAGLELPVDGREPSIATDDKGTWVVAFARRAGAPGSKPTASVSVSKDDGVTFGEPVAIGQTALVTPGEDRWPVVAFEPASGAFVVVWGSSVAIDGGLGGDFDLLVSRSVDGGASWSPPALLAASMKGDQQEDEASARALVSDGRGRLVVVWPREHKHLPASELDIVASSSSDGGVTWSEPAPISPNAASPAESADDRDPALATDGQGSWLVAWTSQDAGAATSGLRLAWSTDGGATWEERPGPAPWGLKGGVDDIQPSLASDGTGGWLLTWASTADPDGEWGTDHDTLWASSLDQGISWTEPRLVSGESFGVDPEEMSPRVVARAASGWLVTTVVQGTDGGTPQTSFMALWNQPLPWTDADVCTDDSCAADATAHSANTGPCDDGDACTAVSQCNADGCVSTGSLSCDDGDPCTDDSCDPQDGCVHTATFAPCNDGDPCTTSEFCMDSGCGGGVAVGCNDDNPCTQDVCVPGSGCNFVILEGPCDDGIDCTGTDICSPLGHCAGTPSGALCDDGDTCTTDTCDPTTGCGYTFADGGACNDGDECTVADTCKAAGCAGDPKDCSDGDACTEDTCTGNGLCGHAVASCDDGNPCTVDICDAAGGCSWTALVDVGCDDGDPCTPAECVDGACVVPALVPAFKDEALLNDWAAIDGIAIDGGLSVATGLTTMVAVLSTGLTTSGLGGDSDVVSLTSKDGGATWGPPVSLWAGATDDSGTDVSPHIAAGPDDAYMAVWTSTSAPVAGVGTDADIFSVLRDPADGSWGTPQKVGAFMSGDALNDSQPVVAYTGSGTWMALWSSSYDALLPGTDRDIWVAHWSSGVWGSAASIGEDLFDEYEDAGSSRSLAGDGQGIFVYVWTGTSTLTGESDVRVSRSDDWGQTWSEPGDLWSGFASDGANNDDDPSIATDGAGTWIVTWTSQNQALLGTAMSLGAVYSRSTDDGVTWSTPLPVTTRPPDSSSATRTAPFVAFTPEGLWVITWVGQGDVVAMGNDADILVSASRDGGVTWSWPVAVSDQALADNDLGSQDTAPVVFWSNAGGILAAWVTENDGEFTATDTDFRIARWTPPVSALPCSDGDATSSDICDPVAQCSHVPLPVSCDDGLDCTTDTLVPGLACEHVTTSEPCP